jgi:4'-phosphopantetheinyl transferase
MNNIQHLFDQTLPSGVDIYLLRFAREEETRHLQEWSILAPSEQARAARFRRSADRVRFAATRATLRRLLAQRMNCAPTDIRFGEHLHGKPFAVPPPDRSHAPLFNVAHSGEHALIALADPALLHEIGIDIERVDEDIERKSLASMVFTPKECLSIDAASDPTMAFYLHWCGKEAVLKAAGVGISEHLQTISLKFDFRDVVVESIISEWEAIQVKVLDSPHGYTAAFAWRPCTPNRRSGTASLRDIKDSPS